MQYIKQLDSIRAIAVLLVLILHWFPEQSSFRAFTSIFNGVDIFFVLSGFLITRILLENRNKAESLGLKKSTIIKSFFIRRSLRIFPIYYLLIFILLLFSNQTGTGIKENFHYFATYTANIYFYNKQGWDGMLSHLWSLSIEEQFYLFWPWLMLFCPMRVLLHVIVGSIIIGIAVQQYISWGGLLTIGCFDGFGFGALLAWILLYRPRILKRTKYLWPILAMGACLLQIARVSEGAQSYLLPSRTLTAIVTFWVIIEIVTKEKRFYPIDLILNNRILLFLGKISYGIYLYHLIVSTIAFNHLYKLNRLLPSYIWKHDFYLARIECFLLVVALAYLSWRFIEKPILQLKHNFEYQNKQKAQAVRATPQVKAPV